MNIDELENKLKGYEEEITMLKVEINKLKEEKKTVKRWRAEKNGDYYRLDDTGEINDVSEDNHYIDNFRYNIGNYFETKNEAAKHKEKLLIYQELKDLALELNNGENIDWNNNNQNKYYIYFDENDDFLLETRTNSLKDIGQIYCLDQNFLDISKERIGKERLKKLFEEE